MTDTDDPVKVALAEVQAQLPQLGEELKVNEADGAALRWKIKQLEGRERHYMVALGIKRPKRTRKKPAPPPPEEA